MSNDEPVPQTIPLPKPRELTSRERGLIDFLLQPPYASDALRAQVEGAKVVGVGSCGCPSVTLAVDPTAPRDEADIDRTAGAPGDLTADQLTSRGQGAQVALHIGDGVLHELEIWGHEYGIRPRVDPTTLRRRQDFPEWVSPRS
jgi:hypothetical protein